MQPKKSIEYAELSWNPFSGCLNHSNGVCAIGTDCWAYNRAKMLANNPKVKGYSMPDFFKPTFHPDKLDEPLKRKKPTIYATCFMGDIAYCAGVWWDRIIDVVRRCPRHTFIMLTKMPEIFTLGSFPENVWFGTTVNKQSEIERIDHLIAIDAKHHWISFEPPFERIDCSLEGVDGIAIGSLTGKNPFMPKESWVWELIEEARRCRTKVVLKDNLTIWSNKLREWP